MLTAVYWIISALILLMLLGNFLEEDSLAEEVNLILIIIPFVMRILFLK